MSLSRRLLLGSGLAALVGGIAGCGRTVSISADPSELVLWYWPRSVDAGILEQAAEQIPGTQSKLRADVVGGSFDVKLRTSLSAEAYIPDLTMINENVSLYFPTEEEFLDLGALGADQYQDQFLDWMWENGVTNTGVFRFWPTNTGPTGFFYRADIFEEAGLPTDVDDVSASVKDWSSYLEMGEKLRADLDVALASSATNVFNSVLACSESRYLDKANELLYLEDDDGVRKAWDIAVKAVQSNCTANAQSSTEVNSAFASGKVAGNVEANWWGPILKDLGPETKGKWRVARQPERAGNSGGSYICLPRTCKDPEAAMAFIAWMLNPENQQATFAETELFPASRAALDLGSGSEDPFFGGQNTYALFKESAKQVPVSYMSPYEFLASEGFGAELVNVEAAGKAPQRAWADAVELAETRLRKWGVVS